MEKICYRHMLSKDKEKINMQTQCNSPVLLQVKLNSPVLLRVKLNLILSGDMKKKKRIK
jgi:hypothetical protein